jgi:hypothetical protein
MMIKWRSFKCLPVRNEKMEIFFWKVPSEELMIVPI